MGRRGAASRLAVEHGDLRNLLRAPLRSLMTVLGIAAGVALFAAVSAITDDLRQQIGAAIDAYHYDVVVHERRAPSPFSSRITLAQMQTLVEEHGEALAPMVIGTLNESWSSYALVMGVEPGFANRHGPGGGAAHGGRARRGDAGRARGAAAGRSRARCCGWATRTISSAPTSAPAAACSTAA